MALPKAWRLAICAALATSDSSVAPAVSAFVLQANPPISTGQNSCSKLNVAANSIRAPSYRNRLTPTATAMLPAAAGAAGAAGAVAPGEAATEAAGYASNILQTGIASSSGSAEGLSSWAPVLLSSGIMDDMDPTKLGLFALGGLGVAAAGFQTAVYWRMQYVVAALLTNRVPSIQGGAEVLELSAKDTKTLYYMPTGGVRRLTMSTIKDLESEIVNGAAIQAKIPTALVRKQEGGKISCNTGTMDCVVSIYGFSAGVAADKGTGAVTVRGLAAEVARVLKPGGTLLFVEKGESKELVAELQQALGTVEVNMVKNLVDPYCVALGTKTKVDVEDDERTASGAKTEAGGNRRERRGKKKAAKSRGG